MQQEMKFLKEYQNFLLKAETEKEEEKKDLIQPINIKFFQLFTKVCNIIFIF